MAAKIEASAAQHRAAKCPHGAELTRPEAAEHMACTQYGRAVDERTVDRWARQGRITKIKVGGLQWVRYLRDDLDRMGAIQPASSAPDQSS
jgi:hypothetical protein